MTTIIKMMKCCDPKGKQQGRTLESKDPRDVGPKSSFYTVISWPNIVCCQVVTRNSGSNLSSVKSCISSAPASSSWTSPWELWPVSACEQNKPRKLNNREKTAQKETKNKRIAMSPNQKSPSVSVWPSSNSSRCYVNVNILATPKTGQSDWTK